MYLVRVVITGTKTELGFGLFDEFDTIPSMISQFKNYLAEKDPNVKVTPNFIITIFPWNTELTPEGYVRLIEQNGSPHIMFLDRDDDTGVDILKVEKNSHVFAQSKDIEHRQLVVNYEFAKISDLMPTLTFLQK